MSAAVTATPWSAAGVAELAGGGFVALRGPALALQRDLDRAFLVLADRWGADEEAHPPVIPAAVLDRVDYFSAFPHLATFPATLDADEANLDGFRSGEPFDPATGAVGLTDLAPVRDVLTPAACYHVYPHHAGEVLGEARFVTTRNTCFRREARYEPLRRQWAFTMREVVCLGDRDEVAGFLDEARSVVSAFGAAVGVTVRWETATDPFFQPAGDPRYLMQRLAPVKHEACLDDGLAIGSVNLHQDHFAATFDIRRGDRPAVTGCLAFGLDRWLHAVIAGHGADAGAWPDVVAAARAVAEAHPGGRP